MIFLFNFIITVLKTKLIQIKMVTRTNVSYSETFAYQNYFMIQFKIRFSSAELFQLFKTFRTESILFWFRASSDYWLLFFLFKTLRWNRHIRYWQSGKAFLIKLTIALAASEAINCGSNTKSFSVKVSINDFFLLLRVDISVVKLLELKLQNNFIHKS